ncbi:MAG TPA: hypothetical protein DEB09_00595 [Candidatus Magasanikbacteria bacterium]|nr:hypothetical protein [Candidatus Magasanikbacteria bacterium]
MNQINYKEIVKNRYFVPVLMGIVIAIGGILVGVSKDDGKTTNNGEGVEVKEIVDIKGKKDMKSLLFGQKTYTLSYASMDPLAVENISLFEFSDGWKGDGFLDWRNFYEGKSSLGVASDNHQPGIVFLEKNLDLSNFDVIEFPLSVSDINSLESIVVKIGDSSLTNYFSYNLSNMLGGWQVVRIPMNQFVSHGTNPESGWKNIQKIQFEVVSRPNTTEIVNFDYLTAQKSADYLSKWKMTDDRFLSLAKKDDKIVLLARNEGAMQAVLSEVNGENFTFQASFVPQTVGGALGLFFRGNYGNSKGYYLLADGINKNSFTLKKLGSGGWEDLKTVEISNFVLEKDQKYWLKVEAKGKTIIGFVSVDGENFTEILNVDDDEFSSGGLGITVFSRSYGFFDDFKFEQ